MQHDCVTYAETTVSFVQLVGSLNKFQCENSHLWSWHYSLNWFRRSYYGDVVFLFLTSFWTAFANRYQSTNGNRIYHPKCNPLVDFSVEVLHHVNYHQITNSNDKWPSMLSIWKMDKPKQILYFFFFAIIVLNFFGFWFICLPIIKHFVFNVFPILIVH